MKVRTYILLILVAAVGLTIIGLALEARHVTRMGFETLKARQVSAILKSADALLKLRRETLEKFVQVITRDQGLNDMLEKDRAKHRSVKGSLEDVALKSSFDLVDIVSDDGTSFFLNGVEEGRRLVGRAQRGEKYSLTFLETEPTLVIISRFDWHSHHRGYLVLGYRLNKSIGKSLSELTGTETRFSAIPVRTALGPGEYRLFEIGSWIVTGHIQVDDRFIAESNETITRNLTILGAVSLIFFIAVLYLFLEFGFLREFKGILSEVVVAGSELERGTLPVVRSGRGRFRENMLLARAFEKFSKSLLAYDERARDEALRASRTQKDAALATMARAVAHDIRGPLSSLDKLVKCCDGIPEEERGLIRECVSRVMGVAEDLLSRNVESTERHASEEPLAELVEAIACEKRLQYEGKPIEIRFELESEMFGYFARIEVQTFKRALSNIIDNAVEAISDRGVVTIALWQSSERELRLDITDSGCGMPAEIVARAGERGVTYGKSRGTGLGLFCAKSAIVAVGGVLQFDSKVGQGTRVTLLLPKLEIPGWYAHGLAISAETRYVILDDEPLIHILWVKVLGRVGVDPGQIVHFTSSTELERWYVQNTGNIGDVRFLLDYELKADERTGLDLAESLEICANSTLITSRADDPRLRERCMGLGVAMVPKRLVSIVPLHQRNRRAETAVVCSERSTIKKL